METPGEDAPRLESAQTLNDVAKHSVIVAAMLRARATKEQIIVALAKHIESLSARMQRLEGIAPRKMICSDGKVLIWRLPEDMIPEDRVQDCRAYPMPLTEGKKLSGVKTQSDDGRVPLSGPPPPAPGLTPLIE